MTWRPPWAHGHTGYGLNGLSGLHGLFGVSSRGWYKLAGLMALWSADEEAGLIALAKQGDRDAIDKLFEHYRPQLVGSLKFKLLHGPFDTRAADAEDVANETLQKVYANIGRFDGRSSFFTWMYRIAAREAVNQYRRNNREKYLESRREAYARRTGRTPEQVQAIKAERAATEESITEAIEAGGRKAEPAASWGKSVFALLLAQPQVMHQILSTMTDIQREIFLLREVQGMPYADIARKLNIPIGTVKYRVFAAREAVEEQLAKIFKRTRPEVRARRKR